MAVVFSETESVIGLETESSFLAALLLEPEHFGEICDEFSPQDFESEANRRIFRAALQLFHKGEEPTIVALLEQVDRDTCAYLVDLTNGALRASDEFNRWLKRFRRVVQRRRVSVLAERIKDLVQDRSVDEDTLIEQTQALVDQTLSSASYLRESIERFHVKKHIDESLASFEQQTLNTGIAPLDGLVTGFLRDSFVIIAARPSVGKTAFSLQLAENFCVHGPVLFVSLEMPATQLALRLLARRARVNLKHLMTGSLTEEEFMRVGRALPEITELPLYMVDEEVFTVTGIRKIAKSLQKEHGSLGAVVIDYLQLMSSENASANRTNQVAEISRKIKRLSRELGCPIIALSQLSRKTEERVDKRPMLSDLRESGSLEQDADVIMFLYRQDYYENDGQSGDCSEVEIMVAKNRNGPCGKITASFNRAYGAFDFE